METLNFIYWCRVGLGVVAALICVGGWALTNTLFASIIEAASLAIVFYIVTYYILKMKFVAKVEKTSKLFTQGIGAYFLTWIISWTLILTLILSPTIPTAAFEYLPSSPIVGESVVFNATASRDNGHITSYMWIFVNQTMSNQTVTYNPIVTHTFEVQGNYTVMLYVTDNDGLVSTPATAVVEVKK